MKDQRGMKRKVFMTKRTNLQRPNNNQMMSMIKNCNPHQARGESNSCLTKLLLILVETRAKIEALSVEDGRSSKNRVSVVS